MSCSHSTTHALLVTAALALPLVVAPVAVANHNTQFFAGRYVLAPGWMAPWDDPLVQPVDEVQSPILGGLVCDLLRPLVKALTGLDILPACDLPGYDPADSVVFGAIVCVPASSPQESTDVGGSCPRISVDTLDDVQIDLRDDTGQEAAYAACVDTNADGVCRPENVGIDYLYFERCGDGDHVLAFRHRGPVGPLALFAMSQTETADSCISPRGTFAITITHPPECADGDDNDGDGFADWPDDPGCDSATDDKEAGVCQDGVDNDGNGLADWPADSGCASAADNYEWSPQCSNGKDDDGDGFRDWPNDPGCSGPSDNAEFEVYTH